VVAAPANIDKRATAAVGIFLLFIFVIPPL